MKSFGIFHVVKLKMNPYFQLIQIEHAENFHSPGIIFRVDVPRERLTIAQYANVLKFIFLISAPSTKRKPDFV